MKSVFALPALLMIALPESAQQAATAPLDRIAAQVTPAPTASCELHLWPAARIQAVSSGWGAQLGMIGALADRAGHAGGDKQRRAHMITALDPDAQTAALRELDLAGLLGLPPSRIIAHPQPLDARAAKTAVRHAPSTSSCYAELIVSGVLYQKTAVHGRALKTGFLFRDFGPANEQPRRVVATGENALKLFPPKNADEVTASNAELISVFQRNFIEAAANFVVQRLMARR